MERRRRTEFLLLIFFVIISFIYFTSLFVENESIPSIISSRRLGRYASSKQLESTGITAQKTQSIILAYYRSGSTFLGELLSSVANTYYNFEPLSYLGSIKIRNATTLLPALDTLRHILQCNYTGLDHFFRWKNLYNMARLNVPLWNTCKHNESLCSDAHYLNEFCAKSPYYVTKVVRFLVKDAETLLTGSESSTKMLLLIRDPRGIMSSRNRSQWCHDHSDCASVSNLCKDMEDDFKSASIFTNKYPQRFKVVRYENLSANPYNMTEKILKFYGLPFDDGVKKFLDTHTKINQGNEYATFRDSKKTPFDWIEHIRFSEIQKIQSECSEAMALWGYKTMDEEMPLDTDAFNPLLDFPFSIDDVM